MEDKNNLITLPVALGMQVNEILKAKINFVPRSNKSGLLSFEFSNDELALLYELDIEKPLPGCLKGIELLPNLKILRVKAKASSHYTQSKNMYSITDEDSKYISKCKNLEVLEIINQGELTYLDVSDLKNLWSLTVNKNYVLEEIEGLDKHSNLLQLKLFGNEFLTRIKNLDSIIMNNPELSDLDLDILLFPDAVSYSEQNGIKEEVIQKLAGINTSWSETVTQTENVKINTYQMLKMHDKACTALLEYVPKDADSRAIVIGIEQYLAENVKYDYDSLKSGHSHTDSSIVLGPLTGANGAYNAFIYNTCVCEGYTRAMQYLLKLKNIKSHNVHCIGVKDTIHMAASNKGDKYKIFKIPNDHYHSIISIDDINYLYDDPCWNAAYFQDGDSSLPWTLLTKEEISRDHTLSFGEKNVSNELFSVPRKEINACIQKIMLHKERMNSLENNEKNR